MDFYEAFHFLYEHDMFKGKFWESLYVEVVKVDPETNCVENERSRNTKTQIWLETGPYFEEDEVAAHDFDLDCGGDTFEEAIVELADLVLQKYGRKKLENRAALFRVNPVII